ncbi:hypothetical protein [Thetidibacter halocola]|uniref:Uncharacterized protein n=1 Tax=Thetidibacter halocola TaxID=2827239 RepID=A0A8J7WCE9_9RHOB|nr:hypothetical protein [Thetidibacter halocola]MBS0125000.1 hypothetical protein [Thetidibacter halocola]
MPTQYAVPEIQQQAREAARQQLARSAMFRAMTLDEQQDVYHTVVDDNYRKLARQQGLSTAMVEGFKDYNPGFEESVDSFEDLVDSVDFPAFVADLLKAVFDANISVQKAQTDDFIRLMREATKSTSDFLKKVDDEDAFAYLVEKPNSQYNLSMEEDPEGGSKLALTTPEGEPVDMDDNEVKAAIMDAKIAMAKEHRAALREVILMGVSRLVVDKGEVEAAVEFRITAKRDSRKSHKDQNINVFNASASYGGGLIGSIFGGPKGSMSVSNTNIQVNTSNQTAQDELFAKLMGRVKIQFKSDYFKLDNFADMYGAGGVAALQPPQQQGGVPAVPAGASPRQGG